MNENEIASEMNKILKKSSAEGCPSCKEWEARYDLQSWSSKRQKEVAVNGLFTKINNYIQYELEDALDALENQEGVPEGEAEDTAKIRIKNVLRFMETRRKNDTTIEEE